METKMVGNKIAEARKKKNISQGELANHLFISQQAVGKWERGESLPDIITLVRLAEILGVDLNYFSENFPSAAEGIISADQVKVPTEEIPSGKRPGKPGWNMSAWNWVDVDFSGLKNLQDRFSSSNMKGCKFAGSDLSGLLLKNNNVASCDFSNSDFSKSRIINSNLSKNIFKECSLKEAEFLRSHFSGCDFSGADFSNVIAKYCGFEKSLVINTVMNHASFVGTQLADMVFEGTIEDCSFENCAFTRVTFQNAKLINTFFKCESLKRIRFIDCQVDRLTYAFLMNGKANPEGITMLAE
jgi:uncharacterized protein YjbI with pentapeptide repeats